jgi:hypothetical protein
VYPGFTATFVKVEKQFFWSLLAVWLFVQLGKVGSCLNLTINANFELLQIGGAFYLFTVNEVTCDTFKYISGSSKKFFSFRLNLRMTS